MSSLMDRPKFTPPVGEKTYEIDEDALGLPRTLLLLEDDVEFAQLLKEYLETSNFSVTVVPDGVQGMRRVMERDYDLIVCDLLMPNLPGDMFYLGVERVKPHLSRRFVFITGHQNNPKVLEFTKKVKALTVYKPFEMRVLVETLRVALKRGQKT